MNCLPNELKIIIVSYIDRPFDFLKSCAYNKKIKYYIKLRCQ